MDNRTVIVQFRASHAIVVLGWITVAVMGVATVVMFISS